MRSAQISFKNKPILIVGGGKQALKKGRQFIEEGAKVTFLAPSISNELREYDCINQTYNTDYLKEVFLVYACTDDKELNHKIILEGNQEGILTASAHYDEEASFHPLVSRDYDDLHIAVSTNGAYPMYIPILLEDIEALYLNHHAEKLKELRVFRQSLLEENVDSKTRHNLLKTNILGKKC